MQVPISDARLFRGESPATRQKIGLLGDVFLFFSKGFSLHTLKYSTRSRGPENRLAVETGALLLSKIGLVGAVAVDVGHRCKGGWVQNSLFLWVVWIRKVVATAL